MKIRFEPAWISSFDLKNRSVCFYSLFEGLKTTTFIIVIHVAIKLLYMYGIYSMSNEGQFTSTEFTSRSQWTWQNTHACYWVTFGGFHDSILGLVVLYGTYSCLVPVKFSVWSKWNFLSSGGCDTGVWSHVWCSHLCLHQTRVEMYVTNYSTVPSACKEEEETFEQTKPYVWEEGTQTYV